MYYYLIKSGLLDLIYEPPVEFECNGYQTRGDSDLSLEYWCYQNEDLVLHDLLLFIFRTMGRISAIGKKDPDLENLISTEKLRRLLEVGNVPASY